MRLNALIVLLLFGTFGHSQSCDNTLSGKVFDLHDGTPLAGALIIVAGTDQAVQANIDGEYSIPGLCNGNYSLQVSHPYCLTGGFQVVVSGNTVRNFRLEHHLEELGEVTVEGSAHHTKTATLLEKGISQKELERFSSGSLGDALNGLSGVSSLNTGNTVVKPMINGLHSSRVVIVNNGVRMEDQEWGSEHAPNVDINSVGSLTLIKGAGALQYGGDAIGGVVVAEPQLIMAKDSLYGKTLLTAASNGRGTTLSTQLTKSGQNGWFGSVQASLKRMGDFESPDYVLSNTGVQGINASVRVGVKRFDSGIEGFYSFFRNEIGILRASHLGGAEDQVRAINSGQPLVIEDFTYALDAPRQEVDHHLARLSAYKRVEGLGKVQVQYDFQRNTRLEYDIRRGDDANKASLDLQLDTHTLMLDLNGTLAETIDFKTGLMGSFQKNFADPATGVRRLIPDYDKYDLGVYGVVDYDLNDKLKLELGARYDHTFMDVYKFYRTSFWESRGYDELFPDIVVEESQNQVLTNPQLTFHNISATAGATYDLGDAYQVFLNLSLASRAPNPSELFSEGLHHSASRVELGDLRFTSEVAHKISLSLERKSENFSFSINPFFNAIDNFVVMEPTEVQQTIRGNFQVWEYRQTRARLMGVDIDASLPLTENLAYRNQFSLVKGADLSRDQPLILMPPVNLKNELIYQHPGFHDLRLSLQSEYVFEQNEFPDNNFEVFLPESQTFEMVDISTPPAAYHLLNFKSDVSFDLPHNATMGVGLSMTNLLNTSYRNYLNRLRYYADDLGRNVLLRLTIDY
ncbi:MAG: TonB-dependent receptor [Sediminicola sp.]